MSAYLLNDTLVGVGGGSTLVRAGDLVTDPAVLAALPSAGGQLWPSTDVNFQAFAIYAARQRLRGADDRAITDMLLAGALYSLSQTAGVVTFVQPAILLTDSFLNSPTSGPLPARAGDSVPDPAAFSSLANVFSSGLFWPAGDPVVAAAKALVLKQRARGADERWSTETMLASALASLGTTYSFLAPSAGPGILLNDSLFAGPSGTTFLRAGVTVVDPALISRAQAAGGVFWTTADPIVSAAASAALKFRARGGDERSSTSTMLAAAAASSNQNLAPLAPGGLSLWLRSDRGFTFNGSAVSAWADFSGNGNNATQASGSNQLTYFASGGANNLPYLQQADTSRWMTGAFSAAISQQTILVVCDYASNGNGAPGPFATTTGPFNVNSGGSVLYVPGTPAMFGRMHKNAGGNLDAVYNAALNSSPHVQGASGSQSAGTMTSNFYLDGVNQATNTAADAGPSGVTNFVVGSLTTAGGNSWGGKIYEIVAYNFALSQSQISAFQAYAHARYGI